MNLASGGQPAGSRIRVFVCGELRLCREGLAEALAGHDALEVVGTGPLDGPGVEAAEAARPDVILVDAASVRARSDVVRRISATATRAGHVVAYGIADEELDANPCGLAGSVSGEATLEELMATILHVAQGGCPGFQGDDALLLKRLSALAGQRDVLRVEEHLTSREGEILALVDEGCSNKEIASRLGIELSTVKNHMHHILGKLHAARRGQAAASVRRSLFRRGTREGATT